MGLVTQNLAHWLGGAYSICPLLRVIVLVIALVLMGTGGNLAVVGNPDAFFSKLSHRFLEFFSNLNPRRFGRGAVL
jgi:hypothetical protein